MIPLNYIIRKCAGGYKFYKSQENNQPLHVYGQHETVWQKWKRTGKSNTGCEDIESEYRDKIWHWKMCQCWKWKVENDKWRKEKNQKARRKGNLQILVKFGNRHNQTSGGERKGKKRIPRGFEKITRNQTTWQKSHQRDKYLVCHPREILETILKVD